MRIAYDLRYASDHFPGIGTHAFHLLEGLLGLPGEEIFEVLWNPGLKNTRFDLEPIRSHARVRWTESVVMPMGFDSPWRMGRLLRSLRPDVYFSPFGIMPWKPKCPCVLTIHDVLPLRTDGVPWRARFWFRVLLEAAHQARFLAVPSMFSRDELVQVAPMASKRVRVVPQGIPPRPATRVTRRPPKLGDSPFALVVGVNKPHKNLSLTVEAWAGWGKHPPLTLAVAGPEDPRYPRTAEMARRRDVAAVIGLGRVSEAELDWLYAHATIVLVPSRYEGFCFPMAEAIGAGAPVLASDIPPLRELGEGVARFLPRETPESWTSEIARLIADPGELERMRCASRVRSGQLGYDRTASAALQLFREAAVMTRMANVAPSGVGG